MDDRIYDVCIVGSGFGGTMAAAAFVEAGRSVVMIERGGYVQRGPHNWGPDGTIDRSPHYDFRAPYRVVAGGNAPEMGVYAAVGGPSIFYGAVSLRYRERDFVADPEVGGPHAIGWPLTYADLAPYYDEVERRLDIAGADDDPIAPPRAQPYPQAPAPLSEISAAIAAAGRSLGHRPFRLPLAINHRPGARQCILCPTCDTYACAIAAKNDLATTQLSTLVARGMTVRAETVAVRLIVQGRRVVALETVSADGRQRGMVRARSFVLAAGALATPHLLLASGLDRLHPAGSRIGRYLMRHTNAIVYGLFARLPGTVATFHKQIGFHDLYFGDPKGEGPPGKLGSIQQIHSPPTSLIKQYLPPGAGAMLAPLARRMTGLIVIAEDQPNPTNRVYLDRVRDRYGRPRLVVEHRYSPRDLAAVKRLELEAKRILRCAGAMLYYVHPIRTFSHALGTVRMGPEAEAPLAADGMLRGVDNLAVADASALPTAAAVNPSLTIAANSLRVARGMLAAGLV